MSNFITTAFVNEFRDNVMLLSQQRMSRLRNAVRVENFTGEKAFFDQLAPTVMQAVTTRHSDTPLIETKHERRMVVAKEYAWADLIDRGDVARTLPDFTNPYLVNAAAAVGRTFDTILINAADGIAKTGKEGGTNTALPAGNIIPNTVGANTGLNTAKLLRAKFLLDQAEVDPSIPRFVCANATQMENLLQDNQVQSSDYNIVKALVSGEISQWLGFNFIRTELIRTVSTDHRVLFWAQDGLLLGINYDVEARVTERDDKNYAIQPYLRMMAGATRMEESKVGVITCAVTPAAT